MQIRDGREEVMVENARQRLGVKGHGARKHLEGHDAERVLITLRAHPRAGALLGAHEIRRAHHRAARRQSRLLHRAGNAEVRDEHASIAIHEDVRALDVPMDDAALVRRREGCAGRVEDDEHRLEWQGAVGLDAVVDAASFDELHRHVLQPGGGADAIHGDDVGMLK